LVLWRALLTGLAFACATGCSNSDGGVRVRPAAATADSAAVKPLDTAKTGDTLDRKASDTDLVAAVGVNKVKVPIQLRFRLAGKPVLGQPLAIELVNEPDRLAIVRSVRFRFEAVDGLQLAAAAEWQPSSSDPARHDLTVTPRKTGVLELHVLASVEAASESLSQVYAIPIVVAAPSTTAITKSAGI
jgi:hypothetical protein